jgi:RNA polymerase sigma-70 factor (ECF subfamily)
MERYDDRKLVKKCIEGNPEAWSEFVDRYSGLIFWAIRRKLNKFTYTCMESEVEDIYQYIFASIWEKKSLICVNERGNIAPWLVVVTSNATMDFIRKKCLEANIMRAETGLKNEPKDERELISLKENKRLLDDAMKLLNEKERSYLELSYISGKKYKDIAEIFKTSINYVSTTIARAKKKIKKYIESKNNL